VPEILPGRLERESEATLRRISLACCVLLLGACAHAPIPQSGTHLRAEEPAPSGTVPAPIQISTILPKPTPTSRPETYSVVVNGVKVQELLFALARDARLNIDVHAGITGTVTINAIEQTLPQLLTRISKQVDMRWELDGPNLIVMPDSPYLHTYRIDYVNMERNATGTVGVSSQIGTGGGTAGGGGAAGGTGGGNTSTILAEVCRAIGTPDSSGNGYYAVYADTPRGKIIQDELNNLKTRRR